MTTPPPKRILIVEDDEPTQQLLRTLMRRGGLESVVATNGIEAIEQLRAGTFDCILLDLMMPTVDGIGVLEFLEGHHSQPPVILCTAAGPKSIAAIESTLVKAVVRKPFDIENLDSIIERLIAASATEPHSG